MTEIVRGPAHSDGAPTIEGTGIRLLDVANADELSGYSPDETTLFYPDLTFSDIHRALVYSSTSKNSAHLPPNQRPHDATLLK